MSYESTGQRSLALCLSLLLLLAPALKAAEEATDENDPTFVSMTRRPDHMSKLPANISVINSKDIEESGAKSLDEVITRAVGVQVNRSGSLGTFSTMRLRGVPSSAQVAILIDDQPYGGFAADQNIDLSQIPVENIDHIEIVRGGSSVLYGANTTGGVVHIFTKKKRDAKADGMIGYEGGSYQTKVSKAEVGANSGKVWGVANVRHYETDGFQRNSDANNTTGSGSVGTVLSNNIRLGVDATAVTHEVGVPQGTSIPISDWDGDKERDPANPTKRSMRHRQEGRFNADIPVAEAGYVKSVLYGSKDKYESIKSVDSISDPDFTQIAHVLGGDARFIGAHGTTVGGMYERDESTSNLYEWKHVTNAAGYVQQSLDLDKLTLIPALRFDHNSNFGNITSPRLSTVYRANKVWTVSANAARSFRAPSFSDLFFDFPPTYMGNRNLTPEKAWTYDFGNEFKVGPRTDFKLVGFYTDITDRIAGVDRDGDGIKETNDNVSQSELAGLETEARTGIGFATLWGNYTYQRSKSPATNKSHFVDIPLNPHHLVNVGLDFALPSDISLSNIVRYVSAQYSAEDRTGTLLPCYAVWNARLSKKFRLGDIYAGVNNILDRHYAESFDFAPVTFADTLNLQPTRNYYAGASIRFALAAE